MKNKSNKKQKSVYVVVFSVDYEGDRVYGIYSTKGKAEKARQAVLDDDDMSGGELWVKKVNLDGAPQWDCLFEYVGVEA